VLPGVNAAAVRTWTGVAGTLLPVRSPVIGLVPDGEVIVPPTRAAAIWSPVGVAMPRAMRFWRTVSRMRAASVGASRLPGTKVTACNDPSAATVLRVIGAPVVSPVTRLSKLAVEPAKSTSWGARSCTCWVANVWVCA
jgi:hypothetical protein